MNNNGQMKDFEDLFKAVITFIIGIILLGALTPLVAKDITGTFVSLGIFMIIMGIFIGIISIILKHFSN